MFPFTNPLYTAVCRRAFYCPFLLLCIILHIASAATRIKANNTTNLNAAGSWDALPGAGDIAQWQNPPLSAANTTVLGGDLSWLGMSILTPGGTVTIGTGNTLTLGTSGIDMSSAGNNLAVNCLIALGGDQTWNTGAQILAVGGVISGGYGITKSGAGTLTLSRANTYTGATTVNAGTLQTLQPGVIQNGSLESPALTANTYTYFSSLTGVQQAALIWISTGNGGNNGCLVNGTNAWGYTTPYPAGNQVFSVQQNSSLTETIYFLVGTYTLSWFDTRRNTQVNPYNVQLDGANLAGSPFSAASTSWAARSTTLSIAAEGFHTINFVGTTVGPDLSVAIDSISLATVSGGGSINVLPSTTALTVAGGATIDFNGNSHTIGSLAGAGTVTSTIPGALTLTVGDNTSTTFSGVIQDGSGTMALTKQGAGTLTLSGANSFSGPTIVNAGTLIVAGTVAGALTVAGGAAIEPTLSGTNGGTLTLSSAVSPVFNATSTLRIRAPSSVLDRVTLSNAAATFACTNVALYIDATGLSGSVTGATIVATAYGAGITGTFASVNGTAGYTYTLHYNASSITVDIALPGAARYWSGTGTWDAATSNWGTVSGGPYTTSIFSTGKDAIFEGTAGTVTVSSPNDPNSLTFNTAGYTLSGGTLTLDGASVITNATTAISSVFAGAGNLFKSGSGMLTLSGANTYTGATAVQNGTMSINTILNVNAGSSAVGAPVSPANGTIALGYTTTTGVLLYTGGARSTDRIIDLAGTTGGGTIDNSGSGLLKFASNFAASGPGAKTLTLQGSSAGEIAGAVVNSSATTALIKAGANTWTLSGANTYTGTTAINSGTLQIGNGGTTGSLSASSAISDNAALVFNRSNTISQGIDFGPISGSGTLTQAGAGTLALANPNTYAGATTVSAGTLQTLKPAAIQNGSLETPALSANSYTYYGSLSGAQKASLIWTSTGNGAIGGSLINNSTAWGYTIPYPAGNQAFSIQQDATLTESIYFLAGTYTLSWYDAQRTGQVNPYNVQLDGVNQPGSPFSAASNAWALRSTTLTITVEGFHTINFVGKTVGPDLSVGVDNISLNAVGSFNIIPSATALTVAGGATVDFDGCSQIIGSLAGAGTVTSSMAGALTLTTGTDSTSTVFSGAIQNGSGTVALTKNGSGTLTLSGANTCTGATTINAGTLLVTGSTAAGSAMAVSSGATLAGTGTVNGAITLNAGSTLAPGTGGTTIGTLTTANVTMNATSTYSVDLDGATPTYDKINSSGTVTCAGALTVTSNTNAAIGKVYVIVNATTISGTFASLPNGTQFPAQGRIFQIAYTATQVTLTDMAISTTRLWNGGNATLNDWTLADNWGGIAPVAQDALQFAGSVRVNPNNNFTVGTGFASIAFNSGASAFTLGGNSIVLNGDITSNSANLQISNIPMTFTVTHTVNTASTGNITLGGIISGAGGLTKSGAQTVTLSGVNSYTGTTTVSAGTLCITGSTNAGSAVIVSSGATLSGSGTINGAVDASATGAIVAPGTAATAGTLTISKTGTALTLGSGSTLNFRIGSAGDQIVLSDANSDLTLAGTINITAGGVLSAGTYTIITYNRTLTNQTLNVGTVPSGFSATVDVSTLHSVKLVVATAVSPAWSQTALGTINGGAIAATTVFEGTTTPNALICRNLSNGTSKWSYATSSGCGNPTYSYYGSNNYVLAASGTKVVGVVDDAPGTELFTPVDLGATAGTPYICPDNTNFFVTYTGHVSKRVVSTGALVGGWADKAVANISTSADIVVQSDFVYVATSNPGTIIKSDAGDFTVLSSYAPASLAGVAINQPLVLQGTTLYVAPNNNTLHAVATSAMTTAKWTVTYSQGSANSGPPFIVSDNDSIYAAAGTSVYLIKDNGGTGVEKWCCTVPQQVQSGPIKYLGTVYFGANSGKYYAVTAAAGTIRTNWPYSAASGNSTSGQWIDLTNSRVIFATTGGNMDAFGLEP